MPKKRADGSADAQHLSGNEVVQPGGVSPGCDVFGMAEDLFRQESGRLVSLLTGMFGTSRLQLAEDVAQEALVRALQSWPYYGIPENPAAWLTQTAKNLALDMVRREANFHRKEPEVAAWLSMRFGVDVQPPEGPVLPGEIADGLLRLIFTCCHPLLPREGQVALALRTLCGFSEAEIASAFLTTQVAVAKRLTRVRQRIRELEIPFEIPAGDDLPPRLDSVLQTLYLLFNEGYKASSGRALVRGDLCREAIRLTTSLAEHRLVGQPPVFALLALMILNTARLGARTDSAGQLLRLREQDRSQWDRELIARGFFFLEKSAAGDRATRFHYEAAIAACHCGADSYENTDWSQILWHYNRLLALDGSPVVALNRAVAVAEVEGAAAGLEVLEGLENEHGARKSMGGLVDYYLYYALKADFERRLGLSASARKNLEKALELAGGEPEQRFLREQIAAVEGNGAG